MDLSRLHVAIYSEMLLQATDLTSFSWPSNVCTGSKSPSSNFCQTTLVASKLELAKIIYPAGAVGFHASDLMVLVCPPSRIDLHSSSLVPSFFLPHTRILLSEEPVMINLSVGCQARLQTLSSWPWQVCSREREYCFEFDAFDYIKLAKIISYNSAQTWKRKNT